MKLGPLEVIVVVIVLFFVPLVLRVVRGDRNIAGKGKKSSLEIQERQVEPSAGNWHRLRRAGIVFIIVAIILVLSAMSMFKWVLKAYLWSFILLAIGLAILFMSRKR